MYSIIFAEAYLY